MGKERTGSSEGKKSDTETNSPAEGKSSDQVARALRSVYDDTLREDVPTEFEDLLKKLK